MLFVCMCLYIFFSIISIKFTAHMLHFAYKGDKNIKSRAHFIRFGAHFIRFGHLKT